MQDLNDYRKMIDIIDGKIIDLLVERVQVVKKVGEYKKVNKIPPLDPKRWNEVLTRLTTKAKEKKLNPELVKEIYNIIHKYALIEESNL